MNYGILAGIGQGINRGLNDVDEYQKTKFLRDREARERQKWADEDALKAAEQSVKPAGTFNEQVDTPDDQPYIKTTTRTNADVENDRAAALRGIGRGDLASEAVLRAQRFGEFDDKKKKEAKQQEVLGKHQLRVKGIQNRDANVLTELMNYYNFNVPDGHQVALSSRPDGGLNMVFVDERTGMPKASKVLSAQQSMQFAMKASEDMMRHELSTLGFPEYLQVAELGLKQGELSAKQTTAGAAATNAATSAAEHAAKKEAGAYGAPLLAAQAADKKAGREPRGHAPSWNIVAYDNAGLPISYDRTNNVWSRDGKEISSAEIARFLPKTTGREPPKFDATLVRAVAEEVRDLPAGKGRVAAEKALRDKYGSKIVDYVMGHADGKRELDATGKAIIDAFAKPNARPEQRPLLPPREVTYGAPSQGPAPRSVSNNFGIEQR